jgi:hypothetical protein
VELLPPPVDVLLPPVPVAAGVVESDEQATADNPSAATTEAQRTLL